MQDDNEIVEVGKSFVWICMCNMLKSRKKTYMVLFRLDTVSKIVCKKILYSFVEINCKTLSIRQIQSNIIIINIVEEKKFYTNVIIHYP